MKRLFHLAQYIAPAVGLAGIAMFAIGLKWDPPNAMLAWQGVPLVFLGLIFRPRPGHPMTALLGMRRERATARAASQEPDDTPEAAEAKAFLAQVIEHHVAVSAHDPGDLPHHAEPAMLVPRLPGDPGRGRSWIGGAPMLPEGMPWPEANGAPMLFVAQVALEELPDGIWGGLGPREGWLGFFMPSEGRIDDDTRVLHLTGPVSERPWPDVPHTFYFGLDGDKARELLAGLGRPAPPHPPRFPVTVRRHDGPVESQRPAPPEWLRSTIQTDYDPGTPAFRPFDRITARALVAALIAEQKRGFDNRYRRMKPEERAARGVAIAALERHATQLEAESNAPFGPAEGEALVAALDTIMIRRQDRGGDGEIRTSPPHSVLDDGSVGSRARVPFEMLVQEAMRTNPDRVPPAVRARYEALWRADQISEYAVMGGEVHKGFIYSRARNPVFLLELPSSDLVGWMFGDGARFGVFIDPADLAASRWDRAWGDIFN